jgi:holdfast attachment protein HfaA
MRPARPAAASLFGFALLSAVAFAGAAGAQSMSANSASFNAGYGRFAGQENQPVETGIRDANGNLVIVDGLIQTGVDQSGFSGSATAGAFDSIAGVSAGSGSTAIGNNLEVVTQGNYNTVIINSEQTNTGNVSASSSH